MRLKFALLATVGALVALAAPASSMAGWYPLTNLVEIKAEPNTQKITTSLGSCSLGNINGATPPNESINQFSVTVQPGTCTTGASITVGSGWTLESAAPYNVLLRATGEGSLTLRYASLPSCKLSGPVTFGAAWFTGWNGTSAWAKSEYHPDSTGTMVWKNDGGTCALAGQSEGVRYEDTKIFGAITAPELAVVNNLSNPTLAIRIK